MPDARAAPSSGTGGGGAITTAVPHAGLLTSCLTCSPVRACTLGGQMGENDIAIMFAPLANKFV